MRKYKIALLFGGMGLEHEVSVSGAEYAYGELDRELFEVMPVFISKGGEWFVGKDRERISPRLLSTEDTDRIQVFPAFFKGKSGLFAEKGEFIELDAAFPLLHGDFGEDGTPHGALSSARIPYIGCDGVASALCYDKIYTKVLSEQLGIPTAKWVFADKLSISEAKCLTSRKLSYPVFIKPARLGSSFGASGANTGDEFEPAYKIAAELGEGRVLIEERISIKAELECGLFKANNKELFTKIGEIAYTSDFYDYETKYNSEEKSSVTESILLEPVYGELIREYSKKLSDLIGIFGICRFDFFLSEDGQLYFNEINTLPGFTGTSLYPRLLEVSGICVRDALTELILDKLSPD